MATDDIDPQYKVGRVLERRGLEPLAARLEALWVAEGHSLRDLADRLNRRVLEAAMVEAGLDPLEGEVENAYRLLTDDDVSPGMRVQQRQELADAGVDVDAVEDDFVTHQSVHTYLIEVLGAEKDGSTASEQIERDGDALRRLQGRVESVTVSTVERLRDTGRLTLGDVDVFVDVSVYCRDCGTQRSVGELLERGGCDCG